SSPNKKFSNDYQAGALSFEFVSNGEKIFTNAGYHHKKNLKLNELSKSSAVHNVPVSRYMDMKIPVQTIFP
ncbi:MAG: heparinase II/III domain-containing protein, partial [Candidatus Puniceispirillales bacterium]